MKKFSSDQLVAYGAGLLQAKGVAQGDARHIAEVAALTEAMGVKTHGMVFFPYVDAQGSETLDPRAAPAVVRSQGATALVDGGGGFAQLALRLAVELALDKVKSHGTAMVAGRNCAWLAGLGAYLVPLARDGYLAQLWAQTSTCVDAAPVGGIDARFSTNPVALAFPADPDPVLSDFATTVLSMGKAKQMAGRGETAREESFLDREGHLTRDPRVVQEGGTLLFLGGDAFGHKGYGLSLWNEALAAVAGGSCNNPRSPTRQCFNLTVIDPQAFGGRAYYAQEMKRFLAHVRSSRLRPGCREIRLPGERSFRLLWESAREGIPLEEEMVETLNRIARKNGVPGLPA
jgi:L-lactate dehydrogenase